MIPCLWVCIGDKLSNVERLLAQLEILAKKGELLALSDRRKLKRQLSARQVVLGLPKAVNLHAPQLPLE